MIFSRYACLCSRWDIELSNFCAYEHVCKSDRWWWRMRFFISIVAFVSDKFQFRWTNTSINSSHLSSRALSYLVLQVILAQHCFAVLHLSFATSFHLTHRSYATVEYFDENWSAIKTRDKYELDHDYSVRCNLCQSAKKQIHVIYTSRSLNNI